MIIYSSAVRPLAINKKEASGASSEFRLTSLAPLEGLHGEASASAILELWTPDFALILIFTKQHTCVD